MRARDILFRWNPASPDGLLELRRELRRGELEVPQTLGPFAALGEVRVITESMLGGRYGPNRDDRRSLTIDVGRALGSLGSETKLAAGAPLTSFIGELAELAGRLEHQQGARVVALGLASLETRLQSEEVTRAAWRDAVACFLDPASTAELCVLRVRQMRELAEARGVDWERRAHTLEYVLSDHARTVARLAQTEVDPTADAERAGWVAEDRLALCEEHLPKPDTVAEVSVWFVVDDAAVEHGYLRVGPVELFAAETLPEALKAPGPDVDEFVPAPEADDWENLSLQLDNLPQAEHRLLARVQLSAVRLGQVRRRAREVLRSMLDIADPHSPWVLLDGEAVWHDGHWSGRSISPPNSDRSRAPHPVFEPTADRLAAFDEEMIARALAGSRDVKEAMGDALWTVSVIRAPGLAQRIVLAVRAIERTLSHARVRRDENWREAAKRFLLAPWIDFTLANDMLDAGVAAVWGQPSRHMYDRAVYDEIHNAVFVVDPGTPGNRPFEVHGLAAKAALALEHLPAGSIEHRLVVSASAVLSSSESALRHLDELEARFDLLLDRADRQRNAVMHGTTSVDEVLASVDEFVVVLAQHVAQEALRQAARADEPLAEFERRRVRLLEQRAQLAAGAPPLAVLFAEG